MTEEELNACFQRAGTEEANPKRRAGVTENTAKEEERAANVEEKLGSHGNFANTKKTC